MFNKLEKEEGSKIGVITTDQWLEKYFNQPAKMCKLARPDVEDEADFYNYLMKFGMYVPSRNSSNILRQLREENVWEKIKKIYIHYQKKWNGPSVDIYIFPINPYNRFYMQEMKGRSGISFPEKIFLFIADGLDDKELEALFIHEYHHAARMANFQKKQEEYTLLDSLLFEGLAELAVLNYCGKKYTNVSTTRYSQERCKYFLNKWYIPNFSITRTNQRHDQLLFGGRGRIPVMMGYAIGYEIAKGYIKNNKIKMVDTFSMPSEKFLENNSFIEKM